MPRSRARRQHWVQRRLRRQRVQATRRTHRARTCHRLPRRAPMPRRHRSQSRGAGVRRFGRRTARVERQAGQGPPPGCRALGCGSKAGVGRRTPVASNSPPCRRPRKRGRSGHPRRSSPWARSNGARGACCEGGSPQSRASVVVRVSSVRWLRDGAGGRSLGVSFGPGSQGAQLVQEPGHERACGRNEVVVGVACTRGEFDAPVRGQNDVGSGPVISALER